jgi:molecular chaperone DnaK
MVRDAEAHAEEDRKLRELVDARNQADGLIHSAQKSIKELGEKVSEEEKKAVETAIQDLEAVIKGDDKEAIQAKTEALAKASHSIAEKAYGQTDAGTAGGAQSHASGSTTGGASHGKKGGDDDIVDAEFEEVKK